MGGPFYVTMAAAIFRGDSEKVTVAQQAFRETLAEEFELDDTGFTEDDPETEHGQRDFGYNFTAFVDDPDEPDEHWILFTYESPRTREGREELVIARLNEICPGLDATANFMRETW